MKRDGSNKKLIFIINHYSANSNQHLFHILNLIKKIAEEGVYIALVIERCDGEVPFIHENIEVYGQKSKNKILRIVELYQVIRRYMKRGYKKVFVRISIHAAFCAVISAKLHHGETYFWHSGQGFEIMDEMSPRSRKSIEKGRKNLEMLGKCIDHFLTGPETMLGYYEKWCHISKEKLGLMYNDIDIERFSPATSEERESLRKELGLRQEQLYILFVHRFSPVRKSKYYLPYCLEKLENVNVHYIFIGDGDDEQDIKNETESLGISNVTFMGSQPNATIQKYYKACDVFFNPTYCEGFPRVVIEAMACGMPIATTDAGGIRDILGQVQKKYVVDVDERDSLVEALRQLIDNETVRKDCIKENLSRVNRYSTESVVKMYMHTFWPESIDE